MIDRTMNALYQKELVGAGRRIARLEGLSHEKYFSEVTFDVHEGEIVGLAGLVGAGCSELSRAVVGLERLLAGRIVVDGEVVAIEGPRDALARGIVTTSEDRKREGLFVERSIKDNISTGLLERLARFGFVKEREERSLAGRYREELGIVSPSIHSTVKNLSGGNQQKVVLARALASRPRVLILNEPTRGIDVGAKSEVYRIVGDLTRRGVGVILISSDMKELTSLADKIVVLFKGKVVAELRRDVEGWDELLAYCVTGHGRAEA